MPAVWLGGEDAKAHSWEKHMGNQAMATAPGTGKWKG
jgi:hypothetical protein